MALTKYIGFFVFLLLLGCSDQKHKDDQGQVPQKADISAPEAPKVWEFLDQKNGHIRLEHTPKGLSIQSLTPAPMLVAFLSLDSQFAPYSALLNHLESMFKGMRFVAVLDKPYPQEQFESYVKAHAPKFILLNPTSDLGDLSMALQTSTWTLPYFLLYSQNGVLQQSYRGAIVEEMLTKDIQDLLKR